MATRQCKIEGCNRIKTIPPYQSAKTHPWLCPFHRNQLRYKTFMERAAIGLATTRIEIRERRRQRLRISRCA